MSQEIALPFALAYDGNMGKTAVSLKKYRGTQLPVFIEKGEDGFYIIECPLFKGCYTQGKTLTEAFRNIREVILLVLEDKQNRDILATYHPQKANVRVVTL
jgi:predicted RNase H-like HicB family nuclease